MISTGSQGEPMSALALLARGENKFVKVGEHDTVILSSHAIPGNESNVNRVIDGLLRAGAEVIHSGIADVHATGHAQADELKTYLSIAQPEWFVPIHGEYRHMVANAKLGRADGRAADDHVLVCEDGDVLTLNDDGLEMAGRVPAGYLYVDGIVGDVGQGVLRDRRVLAEEGVVVVVVTVDIADRQGARRARRSSPAAGCTRRRPRICSTRRATRSPRPSRRRSPPGCATSTRSSATCAAPPASSSTSAPSGGR